jgi:probable F420-dependent oxidoreductase
MARESFEPTERNTLSMQFAIAVAYNDPTHLIEIARSAEVAGFGAIVLSDHLVYPGQLETPYPYTSNGMPRWKADAPWPDPFVAVGSMSAVTERLRFIVSVFVLPLRHPVFAAKSIATASILSNGRLTVGVGAGWMREEFELVGASFADRGRRMNEALDVMRLLWRGGMVEHHAEFYDFGPMQMSPAPEVPIPIYGGGVSDAALRRAATLCDGWASEIQSRDELPGLLGKLRDFRAASTRSGEGFGVCAALRDVYDLDGYRAMADLGVTELITVPWLLYGADANSLEQKTDSILRFGEEVIEKLES